MSKVPPLLTVEEVAEVLRCSPKTVHKMINEGRLRAFKLRGGTGQHLVRETDLTRFINATAAGRTTRPRVKAHADAGGGVGTG